MCQAVKSSYITTSFFFFIFRLNFRDTLTTTPCYSREHRPLLDSHRGKKNWPLECKRWFSFFICFQGKVENLTAEGCSMQSVCFFKKKKKVLKCAEEEVKGRASTELLWRCALWCRHSSSDSSSPSTRINKTHQCLVWRPQRVSWADIYLKKIRNNFFVSVFFLILLLLLLYLKKWKKG